MLEIQLGPVIVHLYNNIPRAVRSICWDYQCAFCVYGPSLVQEITLPLFWELFYPPLYPYGSSEASRHKTQILTGDVRMLIKLSQSESFLRIFVFNWNYRKRRYSWIVRLGREESGLKVMV